MRPRVIDLAAPSNHGLGQFAWTLFSAFVHADPIQLLDHIEVTEAVEAEDPRVKTLVATQLNGSRIGIIAILTHSALGDLATALERTWGWELDDWRAPHTQRTERLHRIYLGPAS